MRFGPAQASIGMTSQNAAHAAAREAPIGPSAARRLVEDAHARHATTLAGFARRLGLDDDEAWDVVQDAHVRLWQQLTDGTEIRDARAWLAGTVYRGAMDRHRLARRVRELRQRLLPPPASAADAGVDRLSIWAAVDRLPTRQRAALYLHYRLDLPFDEVAAAMGVSPGGARTLASRGLAAVKAEFASLEEPS